MKIANLLKYSFGLIVIIPSTLIIVSLLPLIMIIAVTAEQGFNDTIHNIAELLEYLWKPING